MFNLIHDSYLHNPEFTHLLTFRQSLLSSSELFTFWHRLDVFRTFRHPHWTWQKEDRRPMVNCAPPHPDRWPLPEVWCVSPPWSVWFSDQSQIACLRWPNVQIWLYRWGWPLSLAQCWNTVVSLADRRHWLYNIVSTFAQRYTNVINLRQLFLLTFYHRWLNVMI